VPVNQYTEDLNHFIGTVQSAIIQAQFFARLNQWLIDPSTVQLALTTIGEFVHQRKFFSTNQSLTLCRMPLTFCSFIECIAAILCQHFVSHDALSSVAGLLDQRNSNSLTAVSILAVVASCLIAESDPGSQHLSNQLQLVSQKSSPGLVSLLASDSAATRATSAFALALLWDAGEWIYSNYLCCIYDD
jgi:hypothetical protein